VPALFLAMRAPRSLDGWVTFETSRPSCRSLNGTDNLTTQRITMTSGPCTPLSGVDGRSHHADGFGILPDVELRWACAAMKTVAKPRREVRIPRSRDMDECSPIRLTSVTVSVDHAQHARVAERALRPKSTYWREALHPQGFRPARWCTAQQSGLVLSVISQHRYERGVTAAIGSTEGLPGTLTQVGGPGELSRTAYYSTTGNGNSRGRGRLRVINQGYHHSTSAAAVRDPDVTSAASGRWRWAR